MDTYTTKIDQAETQIAWALAQLSEARKLGLEAGHEAMSKARLNIFEGFLKILQADAHPSDTPKNLKDKTEGSLMNAISCIDGFEHSSPFEEEEFYRTAVIYIGAALTYLAPLLGDFWDEQSYDDFRK